MNPIATAPRNKIDILVYHTIHGWMSARYIPSYSWEHHELGTQYEGAVWCFGDDAFSEEVEEANNEYHDGPVTHWMPLPEKPNA